MPTTRGAKKGGKEAVKPTPRRSTRQAKAKEVGDEVEEHEPNLDDVEDLSGSSSDEDSSSDDDGMKNDIKAMIASTLQEVEEESEEDEDNDESGERLGNEERNRKRKHPGLTVERQPMKKKRMPAWHDEHDEDRSAIKLDVQTKSRLRKLRKQEGEQEVKGSEVVKRLRSQHDKLRRGTHNWAKFDDEKSCMSLNPFFSL